MEEKSKPDTEFGAIMQKGEKKGYTLVMDNENCSGNLYQKKEKVDTKHQHYLILLVCLIILGLLCYITFADKASAKEHFDQEVKEKLMEELLKDLLNTDNNEKSVTNIERFGRSHGSQHYEGWRVDTHGQQQNHCLRTHVRTRCTQGRGRKVYNTGPRNVWNPHFEEDFGEDPSWNCHHCCLHQGKTLDSCPEGETYVVDREVGENEYSSGWRVDRYQNGVRIQDEQDPALSGMNVSLTVCNSHLSGSSDWVWLEFKTSDGEICATSEDFNRNSELYTSGKTKTFPWRSMGDCSYLQQFDGNLQFRLRTRKQNGLSWYNEVKICKLSLANLGNIFSWSGEAACEGTGKWQKLSKRSIQ